MKGFNVALLSTLIAAGGGLPFMTMAESSASFEEIIVTAQKRAQRLQDVPISISAFTTRNLENIGAESLEDIAFRTPNFSYQKSSDIKLMPATIRGVNGGVSGGEDQAVAMYIDEVYLGTATAAQFDLFDLERVEILRGPQGTLFGRNTTGGAISFTTKKPTDDFHAIAAATVGNYNLVRLQGMVSGPIVESKVAGKISAVYHDRGGLTDNVYLGEKTNDEHNWSVRGQLRFTPKDDVEFNLSADYREVRREPTREILEDNFLFQLGIPGLDFVSDGDPENFSISQESPSVERLNAWGIALNGVIGFESFDLTSITAYREHEYFIEVDTDTTPILWAYDGDPEDQWQFSQELRLTSTTNGSFDWIAGLYYFHQYTDNQSFVRLGRDILDFLGFPSDVDLFARGNGKVKANSYAAYAQGTYHLNDKLDAIVGLRVSHDKKSINYEQTDETGGVVGVVTPFINSNSWTEVTGDATLSYKINKSAIAYVKGARGYKAGGFNDGLGSEDNPAFDPEYVWSFEGGVKSTLIQNKLVFNFSVFHMRWDDIQIAGFDTVEREGELVFGVFTGNFGKAKSSGFEAEFQAYPFEGLQFVGSLAYLDGKFTEGDPVDPNDPDAEPNIAKGNKLPLAPDWKFTLAAEYSHPVPWGELSWQLEYTYTGDTELSSFGANGNNPLGHVDPYSLLHARVSLDMKNGVNIGIWVRNITDEVHATRFQDLNFPPIFSSFQALSEPRTYGIDLKVRL